MGMVGRIVDFAYFSLLAGLNVLDPFIAQHFVQRGATTHAHLEHTANDIPAFAGKDA